MGFLLLVLLWFVLGLVIGALALAARLLPAAWGRSGWLWMLLLGAASALLGGLLDTWLTGRLFATAAALWVAVLATVAPWLVTRLWTWLTSQQWLPIFGDNASDQVKPANDGKNVMPGALENPG